MVGLRLASPDPILTQSRNDLADLTSEILLCVFSASYT